MPFSTRELARHFEHQGQDSGFSPRRRPRRSFALRCLRVLTGETFGFEASKSASDDGYARALEEWRTCWMTEGRKRAAR